MPEIALTSHFIARCEQRFGAEPAEWHSGLRAPLRGRVWRAVAENEAKLVVGARSALFLPFPDLGLIVVDEEHDPATSRRRASPIRRATWRCCADRWASSPWC